MNHALVKDRTYWVEWQLNNWAAWMRSRSDAAPKGCPAEASGGVHGFTSLGDSEAAYDKLDCMLAEATNAAINGIESVAEQCALYRAYGMVAVYRLRNYQATLALAKMHVAESLARRGIWLGD